MIAIGLRIQSISSEHMANLGWDNDLLAADQSNTIRLQPTLLIRLRMMLENEVQGHLIP